jgi:hypothetical protein
VVGSVHGGCKKEKAEKVRLELHMVTSHLNLLEINSCLIKRVVKTRSIFHHLLGFYEYYFFRLQRKREKAQKGTAATDSHGDPVPVGSSEGKQTDSSKTGTVHAMQSLVASDDSDASSLQASDVMEQLPTLRCHHKVRLVFLLCVCVCVRNFIN